MKVKLKACSFWLLKASLRVDENAAILRARQKVMEQWQVWYRPC
jgi:hypothetical protein